MDVFIVFRLYLLNSQVFVDCAKPWTVVHPHYEFTRFRNCDYRNNKFITLWIPSSKENHRKYIS